LVPYVTASPAVELFEGLHGLEATRLLLVTGNKDGGEAARVEKVSHRLRHQLIVGEDEALAVGDGGEEGEEGGLLDLALLGGHRAELHGEDELLDAV